ncbi:hypothetical protein ACHAXR_001970, partial [Thalassiosira sp. AJA248-18]
YIITAALHALKRYNDAIAAYEEGLVKFPDDAALKKGLGEAKRDKDGPPRGMGGGGGGFGGMGGMPGMTNPFGDQLIQKMMLNPKTRPYLNDKEFMAKIQMLQRDPNSLGQMLSDPKVMEVLGLALGGDRDGDDDDDGAAPPKAPDTKPSSSNGSSSTETKKDDKPPAPEKKEEEEDLSQLTPAERKKKEDQKAAVKAKERGNELYKSKKFDEAHAAYDEAIALDPTNMTFVNNKAAVYFTAKKYDECIESCLQAVEVGKANRAPFEDRAKAFTRCAKAYQKKGDLANAIKMCQEALLENYDKTTERLMKNMELEKKKADTMAYHDDDKAEEAKQRGNEHFRNKSWGDAVKEYEEAVKRAPTNAPIRNNLAAALCKVMDFNGAKRNIEKAIDLDPKYVKAWARKGDIEVLMKENHKALESYKAGLGIDPSNAACKEGLRKVTAMINYGNSTMTEEEKEERARHGMADPEIQSILSDPMIRQVLKDFNENPTAANKAMSNPVVRAKIEKLIASGVVQTG